MLQEETACLHARCPPTRHDPLVHVLCGLTSYLRLLLSHFVSVSLLSSPLYLCPAAATQPEDLIHVLCEYCACSGFVSVSPCVYSMLPTPWCLFCGRPSVYVTEEDNEG